MRTSELERLNRSGSITAEPRCFRAALFPHTGKTRHRWRILAQGSSTRARRAGSAVTARIRLRSFSKHFWVCTPRERSNASGQLNSNTSERTVLIRRSMLGVPHQGRDVLPILLGEEPGSLHQSVSCTLAKNRRSPVVCTLCCLQLYVLAKTVQSLLDK